METAAPAAPVAPVAPAAPAATPSAAAPAQASTGPQPDQNTAGQAPATAPAGEKTDVKTDSDPEKQRGTRRFERKLDRAYRQKAEAEARADFLAKELEKHRQPAKPEGSPTLAQFDYDPEKYAKARADFESANKLRDYEAKQRTETHKQEQDRLRSGWEEKAERAEGKYEDFDEVVGELTPGTPFVDAIMEAENAEDVAYYLGKHPDEARRIAQLHPRSQIREIGRLEAKLLATPPQAKQPSKAPAPITPLTGTSTADAVTPSARDDIGTWIKKRQKQVHGARR